MGVCGIYEKGFPCSAPLDFYDAQREESRTLKDGMFAWETGSWRFMTNCVGLLFDRCCSPPPRERYTAHQHLQCETVAVWLSGLYALPIAPRCCFRGEGRPIEPALTSSGELFTKPSTCCAVKCLTTRRRSNSIIKSTPRPSWPPGPLPGRSGSTSPSGFLMTPAAGWPITEKEKPIKGRHFIAESSARVETHVAKALSQRRALMISVAALNKPARPAQI